MGVMLLVPILMGPHQAVVVMSVLSPAGYLLAPCTRMALLFHGEMELLVRRLMMVMSVFFPRVRVLWR